MPQPEKLLVDRGSVAWLYNRVEQIKRMREKMPSGEQFLLGESAGIMIALDILGLEKEQKTDDLYPDNDVPNAK